MEYMSGMTLLGDSRYLFSNKALLSPSLLRGEEFF